MRRPAALTQSFVKMPDGGDEERNAQSMLRDVGGFIAHFHLQDRIFRRVEAVERSSS
jgi:hypothetical protein